MEKLELYIPKPKDIWFYQQMMSDSETMSYNAGWDVDYEGYHPVVSTTQTRLLPIGMMNG